MVYSLDIIESPGGATANGRIAQILRQIPSLAERTNHTLLEIIAKNLNTQYAVQAPSLRAFRDAIFAHGDAEVDATFIEYFRSLVPLSNYSCYKPFVDRFDMQPCKIEDVENLFAPGLPDFFASSSSTTGVATKFLARYKQGSTVSPCPFFNPSSKTPLAAIAYCGFTDMKEIQDAHGQVVKNIPVCSGTGRMVRGFFGWEFEDDESRMSMNLPYYAVPWAATTISHFPSLLTIHAIFFLANRNIDRFYVPFAARFVDLIHNINEQWDIFLSCIESGMLPDLEEIDDVRRYLQAQFNADPERAAELRDIGSPFSVEGWATLVWPKLGVLCTVCTGPWSIRLPKLRSILGPNVLIHSPGYGASESNIGIPHDMNKPDEYVLPYDKVIEFLDVTQGDNLQSLRQAWEVEVGMQYEPILTTKNGLWRYHLGDVVSIIGFHTGLDSPIFKYFGRKLVKIQFPHAQIADFHLVEALRVVSSEDTIIVEEFTTLVDDRAFPPTLGFVVELTRAPGPNAHLAPQKMFDILAATQPEHRRALDDGRFRLPTIRIVKPGTFSEYCCWRAKILGGNPMQYKVPTVMADPTTKGWVLERVVEEL